MSALDRKGGDPVSLPGPEVPVEGTDYPRNPAGPVIAESSETKFNRK
jgi:hypothetical protein